MRSVSCSLRCLNTASRTNTTRRCAWIVWTSRPPDGCRSMQIQALATMLPRWKRSRMCSIPEPCWSLTTSSARSSSSQTSSPCSTSVKNTRISNWSKHWTCRININTNNGCKPINMMMVCTHFFLYLLFRAKSSFSNLLFRAILLIVNLLFRA